MTSPTAAGANVLDVRNSYTFYGREESDQDLFIYAQLPQHRIQFQRRAGKLVAFHLSAAVSSNLADPDSDERPRFAVR